MYELLLILKKAGLLLRQSIMKSGFFTLYIKHFGLCYHDLPQHLSHPHGRQIEASASAGNLEKLQKQLN